MTKPAHRLSFHSWRTQGGYMVPENLREVLIILCKFFSQNRAPIGGESPQLNPTEREFGSKLPPSPSPNVSRRHTPHQTHSFQISAGVKVMAEGDAPPAHSPSTITNTPTTLHPPDWCGLKTSFLSEGRKVSMRCQVRRHNLSSASLLCRIPAVCITSSMFFNDSGIASH